ncbi:MAG: GNAT family N-acetyltransferase [Alphaproteobacteria bacterium]|nr:GNAT family N-acetyltransferase [Alphaproteobacteria bacterium]
MPKIEVVGAESADIFADLHSKCFKKAWNESMMRQTLLLPGSVGFIAYDEKTMMPVGFIIYAYTTSQDNTGTADIITVGVIPEYRGKGFSDLLFNNSFVILKSFGVGEVFLEVAVDNAHALNLYRRTGFEQVGKRPQYYVRGNEKIDALVFKYSL